MKINKFEIRFILFLFMLSIACKLTLNFNTNSKSYIKKSRKINLNKLQENLKNLLELSTNSNFSFESEYKNSKIFELESNKSSFNSSLNSQKNWDDNSTIGSEIKGINKENAFSDVSENLINDLEEEERAQSESTVKTASELSTKDPLRGRDKIRYKLFTKKTSTDKGNIHKLSQFDVKCPKGEVLSGYHMWGESNILSSNQIGIEYNCVKIPDYNAQKNKLNYKVSNSFEVKGDVNDALLIISKKDLNIVCPDRQVISRFAYISRGKSLGLQTSCVTAKVKDCKSVFTDEENIKTLNKFGRCINQYSQFYIDAEPKKILQKVRHFKVSEDRMKILITSCTLEGKDINKQNEDEKKKKEEETKKKQEEEKEKERKKKEEEKKENIKNKELHTKLKKGEEENKQLKVKKTKGQSNADKLTEQNEKFNQVII